MLTTPGEGPQPRLLDWAEGPENFPDKWLGPRRFGRPADPPPKGSSNLLLVAEAGDFSQGTPPPVDGGL